MCDRADGSWQGMKPEDSEDIWDDVHRLLAPYMFQSITEVKGMWIKIGQYLSSRADLMPEPYLEVL